MQRQCGHGAHLVWTSYKMCNPQSTWPRTLLFTILITDNAVGRLEPRQLDGKAASLVPGKVEGNAALAEPGQLDGKAASPVPGKLEGNAALPEPGQFDGKAA